jgi:hypothetical protein
VYTVADIIDTPTPIGLEICAPPLCCWPPPRWLSPGSCRFASTLPPTVWREDKSGASCAIPVVICGSAPTRDSPDSTAIGLSTTARKMVCPTTRSSILRRGRMAGGGWRLIAGWPSSISLAGLLTCTLLGFVTLPEYGPIQGLDYIRGGQSMLARYH